MVCVPLTTCPPSPSSLPHVTLVTMVTPVSVRTQGLRGGVFLVARSYCVSDKQRIEVNRKGLVEVFEL